MEKTPEKKSSPESQREVTAALQSLFLVLKEHGAKLTDSDMNILIRRFTQEVDEYLGHFLERMKRARLKREEIEGLVKTVPEKEEKIDSFAIEKFITGNFTTIDRRTNRNFPDIKKFFEEELPGIIIRESPAGTVVEFEDLKSRWVYMIPYINTRIERNYIPYFQAIAANLPVIRVIRMAILDRSGEKEKVLQIGEVDQKWK